MSDGMMIFFAVLIVLLIMFYPFGLIWAVNTLFNTAIPMTFTTWCAALILSGPFMRPSSKKD